jgi:hypothetical protein
MQIVREVSRCGGIHGSGGSEMSKKIGARAISEAADAYFEGAGRGIATLAGLALALGYETSGALTAMKDEEGAAASEVRRALSRLEEAAERMTYDEKKYRGGMFLLQCKFGWSEKAGERAQAAAYTDAPALVIDDSGGYRGK